MVRPTPMAHSVAEPLVFFSASRRAAKRARTEAPTQPSDSALEDRLTISTGSIYTQECLATPMPAEVSLTVETTSAGATSYAVYPVEPRAASVTLPMDTTTAVAPAHDRDDFVCCWCKESNWSWRKFCRACRRDTTGWYYFEDETRTSSAWKYGSQPGATI